MSGPSRLSARSGLTLIELVLTLTILAIAGALVSGALTTALRAWQSGFQTGREELIAGIVVERIAAQLRAVVDSKVRQTGQEEREAFDAGEGKLRFVTLAAGGAAPAQVSYSLHEGAEGRRLVYREYPWPDKEFFGDQPPRREEQIPEIAGFSVKVTKGPPEDLEPGELPGEWSPLDQQLPVSVAIELTLRSATGDEPRTLAIEVALPTQVAP